MIQFGCFRNIPTLFSLSQPVLSLLSPALTRATPGAPPGASHRAPSSSRQDARLARAPSYDPDAAPRHEVPAACSSQARRRPRSSPAGPDADRAARNQCDVVHPTLRPCASLPWSRAITSNNRRPSDPKCRASVRHLCNGASTERFSELLAPLLLSPLMPTTLLAMKHPGRPCISLPSSIKGQPNSFLLPPPSPSPSSLSHAPLRCSLVCVCVPAITPLVMTRGPCSSPVADEGEHKSLASPSTNHCPERCPPQWSRPSL
jgi:hypothetical protein